MGMKLEEVTMECWCGQILVSDLDMLMHGEKFKDVPVRDENGVWRKIHSGERASTEIINGVLMQLNELTSSGKPLILG